MSTALSQPPMTAPLPTSSSGINDPFLSARTTNARRSDRARRPSQVNLRTRTLDAVPEHATSSSSSSSRPAPPTAYRPVSSDGRLKGKGRAEVRAEPVTPKRAVGDWILDLDEVTRGADRWSERERVVLVIGCPSADMLAPLLYNPSFEDTLILVGSAEPLPSIEALTSPSFLLHSSPDRTVYPTLQPFTLDKTAAGTSSTPAIIQQATTLAQQYRRAAASSPRTPRRRDSSDSSASYTPPRTPPLTDSSDARLRQSFESGAGSIDRAMSDFSRPDLPKSSSETSLRAASRSRLSTLSLGREKAFSSLSRTTKLDSKPWNGGSPLDVVINFIPPGSDFEAGREMQDMLHQAVVLTSGIIPTLARRPAKTSTPDPLAVSLIHVLPSQVPGPLPGVVENFLLGLIPKFAAQSEREIWSSVVTIPAWLAPPRHLSSESRSGAEALLFGGLRCTTPSNPDHRLRAFLPNWSVCIPSPGLIARSKARRPAPVSLRSVPPSIGYASTEARTPPVTGQPPQPQRLQSSNSANRVILRGGSPFDIYTTPAPAPGTPELDPSYSSCSSVSGVGELGSNGTGSDEGCGSAGTGDKPKKKKGLAGWFQSKGKK